MDNPLCVFTINVMNSCDMNDLCVHYEKSVPFYLVVSFL